MPHKPRRCTMCGDTLTAWTGGEGAVCDHCVDDMRPSDARFDEDPEIWDL